MSFTSTVPTIDSAASPMNLKSITTSEPSRLAGGVSFAGGNASINWYQVVTTTLTPSCGGTTGNPITVLIIRIGLLVTVQFKSFSLNTTLGTSGLQFIYLSGMSPDFLPVPGTTICVSIPIVNNAGTSTAGYVRIDDGGLAIYRTGDAAFSASSGVGTGYVCFTYTLIRPPSGF